MGDRTKHSWTPERVEHLRVRWADGVSASTIAGELGLGVTRNAVLGKVDRLDLATRTKYINKRRGRSPLHPWQSGQRSTRNLKRESMKSRVNTVLERIRIKPAQEPDFLPSTDEVDVPLMQRRACVDIEPHQCRWVIGDPRQTYHYCHHSKLDALPYCEAHARRAYEPARVARSAKGAIHRQREIA